MSNLSQLVETIKQFSVDRQYILENINNLTEEEVQDIIIQVAEEQDLTEEEVQTILNELFGIGATVGGIAKRVGTAVATPFKRVAGFVKGIGSGIANASRSLDAKAAAHQKSKLDAARAKQQEKVKSARDFGQRVVPGGKPKPKPSDLRLEPMEPKPAPSPPPKPRVGAGAGLNLGPGLPRRVPAGYAPRPGDIK